jgi:hypothetical protein
MEVCEKAGVPAVGLFGEQFAPMAELLADQVGIPGHRLSVYPGMLATASRQQLADTARTVLTPEVIDGLTTSDAEAKAFAGLDGRATATAGATRSTASLLRTAFSGTLDEIQDEFDERGWSDGLPVIPPTADRVGAFLDAGGRSADDVLGVLPPERREATVASVAVNGVMAGCRPEYMPILLAIVDAICDPEFRMEDAGSTPGWEPLVIISGPLAEELNFNAGTGAMRVGRRPNSSVGRFTRMYMRNIAGLRIPPYVTDQAGFGYTFNVAMAENDRAIDELGWNPFRVDRGFDRSDTTVTVQSVVCISSPIYSHGDDPMDHLRVLSHCLTRAIAPNVSVPTLRRGASNHIMAMSPSIAQVFADHGMSKEEVRHYLWEHTTEPVGFFDSLGPKGSPFDLEQLVREGRLPPEYAGSNDPDRLIRTILTEDALRIVVSGNPGRNQSRAYISNHAQGPPMTRRVVTG